MLLINLFPLATRLRGLLCNSKLICSTIGGTIPGSAINPAAVQHVLIIESGIKRGERQQLRWHC